MIVTYTPDGAETRTWDYKAADLPSIDAEDIEDATGTTFDEFQVNLLKGGMKARRALMWVLLRRDDGKRSMRFKDVSFRVGEVVVEWDGEEKAKVRAEVEKSTDLSDGDRDMVLRLLDDDGGDEAPKGPTPGGASAPGD